VVWRPQKDRRESEKGPQKDRSRQSNFGGAPSIWQDALGMPETPELRERREAVVREHMDSENDHDFDTTIGTFEHPRYELIATGNIYDGEAEVLGYYAETRTAFPDQRNDIVAMYHSDDSVIVEFDLRGTHLGPLRALPPTGRSFRCRMIVIFFFAERTDRIVCERAYFDQLSIMRQLGVAHDPNSLAGRVSTLLSHPLTIGRALLRARRSNA
jgi:steroid delta-isomerase-like uncharacterized protein